MRIDQIPRNALELSLRGARRELRVRLFRRRRGGRVGLRAERRGGDDEGEGEQRAQQPGRATAGGSVAHQRRRSCTTIAPFGCPVPKRVVASPGLRKRTDSTPSAVIVRSTGRPPIRVPST